MLKFKVIESVKTTSIWSRVPENYVKTEALPQALK